MTRMLSLWSLSLTISVSGTRRNDTGAGSGSAVTWRHPLLQSGVSPEILHHQPVVYIYYLLHSLDHTNKTFWQLHQWNYMCTKTKWLFNLLVLMLLGDKGEVQTNITRLSQVPVGGQSACSVQCKCQGKSRPQWGEGWRFNIRQRTQHLQFCESIV